MRVKQAVIDESNETLSPVSSHLSTNLDLSLDICAKLCIIVVEECMRIVILTIGSRGDVQPYVALGRGLQKAGHTVTLATHSQYSEITSGNGIHFAPIGGNAKQMLESQSGQAWLCSGFNPIKFTKQFMNILEPFGEPY